MSELMLPGATMLPEFLFDQESPQQEGFVIDNDDKASWAANKVLAAEHRITLRHELALRYKARIDEWLDRANQHDLGTIDSLGCLLKHWLRSALGMSGRIRSIKLLGATIGLRKRPDKVEIESSDAVIAFCEEFLPEALVVKKELSKTTLKDALSKGVEIPGTYLVVGEDELSIKGA